MVTYVLIGLCAAAAVAFMLTVAFKCKPWVCLTLKTVASLLFVGIGISAYFYGGYIKPAQYAFLLTGLSLGVLGDTLLACKEVEPKHADLFILLGIAAFGAGHIMYVLLFGTMNGASYLEPILALALSVAVALVTKLLLRFNYRKLFLPVTMYCFVILFMLIASFTTMVGLNFSPASIMMAVGSSLFVISDLVLCVIYFGPKKIKGLGAINLTTYYAAQILLASSLMLF